MSDDSFVIRQPAGQRTLALRESYLAICDNDACEAQLLNAQERWYAYKLRLREQARAKNKVSRQGGDPETEDEGLWVRMNAEGWVTDLLRLYNEKTVRNKLKSLEGRGFISTRSNPRQAWDRTPQWLFRRTAVQDAVDLWEATRTVPDLDPDPAERPDGSDAEDQREHSDNEGKSTRTFVRVESEEVPNGIGQNSDLSRTNVRSNNTGISTQGSFPDIQNSGGASNSEEDARAQASEAGLPASGLASAPRTTTDQAALQHSVAPERTPTAQALLEPPDTLTSEGPVPPDGGAAHAASDLSLTDADLDELFTPGNGNDTSPKEVPAAGGAAPALRVADLVPVPRVELAERPAGLPSGPEYRMIRSLVTGKQLDAGLLEQATPTGGLSRQDWLRLTVHEIGLVKTAAQSEAQAEGTGFVTLAIRGLDRMIGAVRRESPNAKAETGGADPDTVARYDPKLPVGARCTVGGQLGVVWKITHGAYIVDRDDGERVTVDRAVAAQLRRLKASTAPAPSGPVVQPAQSDALGAVGSKWQPKAGGDDITVTAIEGATRVMSDGTRVPVYALTSKFIPA